MSLPLETRAGVHGLPRVSPLAAALSPMAIGLATLLLAFALLALPISLPIGAMYWDVVVFVDGGWRVLNGQTPSVDFFAPVGRSVTGCLRRARGLRQAAAAPAGAVDAAAGDARRSPSRSRAHRPSSRTLALALLLPFLVFQLLPTNLEQFSSYPGVDGFGIYNRHGTQLLYVLMVALVFERRQRVLLFVIAWTCARCSCQDHRLHRRGRPLRLRVCRWARPPVDGGRRARGVRSGAGGAGDHDGRRQRLSRRYRLARRHERGRPRQPLRPGGLDPFRHFRLGLPPRRRPPVPRPPPHRLDARRRRAPPFRTASWVSLLDRNVVWLGVALLAGLFFETQNTGGQAFIFIWPVLVRIACDASRHSQRATAVILSARRCGRDAPARQRPPPFGPGRRRAADVREGAGAEPPGARQRERSGRR